MCSFLSIIAVSWVNSDTCWKTFLKACIGSLVESSCTPLASSTNYLRTHSISRSNSSVALDPTTLFLRTPPQSAILCSIEMAKQMVALVVLLVCILSVQVSSAQFVPAPAPYMRGWEPVPAPLTYTPIESPADSPAGVPISSPTIGSPVYSPSSGPSSNEAPAYAPGPVSGLWVLVSECQISNSSSTLDSFVVCNITQLVRFGTCTWRLIRCTFANDCSPDEKLRNNAITFPQNSSFFYGMFYTHCFRIGCHCCLLANLVGPSIDPRISDLH